MAPHRSQSRENQKEAHMPEAKEVFTEIENRIKSHPEKSAGLNATYQFDLSGESCTLQIANGYPTLTQRPAHSPNTTLRASTNVTLYIPAHQPSHVPPLKHNIPPY